MIPDTSLNVLQTLKPPDVRQFDLMTQQSEEASNFQLFFCFMKKQNKEKQKQNNFFIIIGKKIPTQITTFVHSKSVFKNDLKMISDHLTIQQRVELQTGECATWM